MREDGIDFYDNREAWNKKVKETSNETLLDYVVYHKPELNDKPFFALKKEILLRMSAPSPNDNGAQQPTTGTMPVTPKPCAECRWYGVYSVRINKERAGASLESNGGRKVGRERV